MDFTKSLPVLTLVLLAGCEAGFSSGHPTDRALSSLTEFEARRFCRDVGLYISDRYSRPQWTEILCTERATDPIRYGACQDRVACADACRKDKLTCQGDVAFYGRTFSEFTTCETIDDYDYEGCTSYTWEVEECVDELADVMGTYGERRDCSTIWDDPVEWDLSSRCLRILSDLHCSVLIYGG